MALENKLGLTSESELARVEEKISKTKAWSFTIPVCWTVSKSARL